MIIPLQLSFNPSSGGWFAACVVGVLLWREAELCRSLLPPRAQLELLSSPCTSQNRSGTLLLPFKNVCLRWKTWHFIIIYVCVGARGAASICNARGKKTTFPPLPSSFPLSAPLSPQWDGDIPLCRSPSVAAGSTESVSYSSFQKARLSRRGHWCKTQHRSRAAAVHRTGGGRMSLLQVPSFSGSVAGAACAERVTMFTPVIMGGSFYFTFYFLSRTWIYYQPLTWLQSAWLQRLHRLFYKNCKL